MKILHRLLWAGISCLSIALSASVSAETGGSLPLKLQKRSPLRIVGGSPATERAYPWLVALEDSTGDQFCGGTLISKNKILTAAHCSFSGTNRFQDPVRYLRVRVGSDKRGSGGQVFNVTSHVVHPKYNPIALNYDYDVAIWTIKTTTANPVTLSDSVNIVKLPEACDDLACFTGVANPGTTVLTAGWGSTSDGSEELSPDLLDVSIPIVSNAECESAYGGGAITERMICAGVEGKDSCQGDSGGPLFAYIPEARAGLQAGIVSWGDACATTYGVYTRISNPEIRAFIRKYANI